MVHPKIKVPGFLLRRVETTGEKYKMLNIHIFYAIIFVSHLI